MTGKHMGSLFQSQPSQEMNTVWFPLCCVGEDCPFRGAFGWLFRVPKGNNNNSGTKYHHTFLAVTLKACFLISLSVIFRYPSEPVCVCLLTQSCPTLCNTMDYTSPGFSVYEIFQARMLEWVAIAFSRGSFQPRDQTWVSCIAGRFFYPMSHQGSRGETLCTH